MFLSCRPARDEHHVAWLGAEVLAAIDQQGGARDGRRLDQEAHRAGDILGCGRAFQRRHRMGLRELAMVHVARQQRDPGRDAGHAHARCKRLRQQRGRRLERRLRQRVRKVVRVGVPQLLVEQVDHAAARIGCALAEVRGNAPARYGSGGAPVTLHRAIAEAPRRRSRTARRTTASSRPRRCTAAGTAPRTRLRRRGRPASTRRGRPSRGSRRPWPRPRLASS